ncbi:MAG: DUF4252 domain-containing protein [Clostridium sp.]|nr:DUF4252 domain-containing protein [Bacteroides sp.]MCM1199228.1 DUF4252 domain-containing protein [Clostridium sp.]MCM1515747.1 DUF4252 domain-containing protein [Paraprevotella sp.]
MKKIIISAAMMLLTITGFAQDGKSIYKKYSEAKNVSAVYISPAMFRMIGKIPDMEVGGGGVNLTPVIKSLTGMYLIDSENVEINASIRKDVEAFVNSGSYEILMEAKDDGETMRIYTVSKDNIVTSFVLLAYEKDECTFICLDGQMAQEQLEKLIAQAAN